MSVLQLVIALNVVDSVWKKKSSGSGERSYLAYS
jgi:hypothetical protein